MSLGLGLGLRSGSDIDCFRYTFSGNRTGFWLNAWLARPRRRSPKSDLMSGLGLGGDYFLTQHSICYTTTVIICDCYNNKCPPPVAMFGVQRGEGTVMLSYNSTYTRSITNSPCTPPAPCTLDSISHSGTSPVHMCNLLCAAL